MHVAATTPRVIQRCSILESRKKKKKNARSRERERARGRDGSSLVGSRLKSPKFRRGEPAGEQSDVQRPRDRIFREHVFAGDCGSRRDAGNVGVSRPCATGSGRANTETNPRHHHPPPPPPPPPPTLPPSTMPHPLLRRPPLPPPPLFREPSDSLPFNRYPSPPPLPSSPTLPSAVLMIAVWQAFFRRYSNPYATHVLSENILYREVGGTNLFNTRIFYKRVTASLLNRIWKLTNVSFSVCIPS
ncbi:hypothetical protein ALC62_07728 [Cyphomyrmex costatus]|uniref:PRELI/MSF1 domain-containing protein n=1 Tax=Cyphomyrmex costatus TaxID=456900 RepID=A0A195CLF1_9HYME|nr:hypothetical protein ALC62_07728 [Cyphomyrmex costatus]